MPAQERRTKIIEAMMVRDGGTTCVSLEHMGRVIHVTVDQKFRFFPCFLRPRFIFLSERTSFAKDQRLLPWGRTETYYITEIAREAVHHLGLKWSVVL